MRQFPIDEKFAPWHKIKKGTHRRFVIADIHGFFNTFHDLLDKIGLNKTDQLFLLGDYIDKGKKGKEVLDLIIELIDTGYSIFPLRGNHEAMLLASHAHNYTDKMLNLPTLKKSKGIRDEKRKIYPKYLRLLKKLPYYYELDNFFLVHGGFDFSSPSPFTNYKNMLWISEFKVKPEDTKGKYVIHGHKIFKISEIKHSIEQKHLKIGLDNGIYFKKAPYGNLVCLNLDTFELTVQKKIDQ